MMNRVDWKNYFEAGEELRTMDRSSPFKVIGSEDDGLRIRLLARQGEPELVLGYKKLNALVAHIRGAGLPQSNLNKVANKVWEEQDLGKDTQNEAQYWAVACATILSDATDGFSDRNTAFSEGRRFETTQIRIERNSRLRAACLEKHGWACVVCKVNFVERYGDMGKGVIHVHHLDPISQAVGTRSVTVDDVRPVCPNCHAMLHHRRPIPYSPEELLEMIRNPNKSNANSAAQDAALPAPSNVDNPLPHA